MTIKTVEVEKILVNTRRQSLAQAEKKTEKEGFTFSRFKRRKIDEGLTTSGARKGTGGVKGVREGTASAVGCAQVEEGDGEGTACEMGVHPGGKRGWRKGQPARWGCTSVV